MTRITFRDPVVQLLAVAVASHALIIAVATFAGMTIPQTGASGWNDAPGFVNWLSRWDTGYYTDLATRGYEGVSGGWAFPPLYPLLIAGGVALGLDRFVAGAIIANVAFLACVPLLYHLTRHHLDERTAFRASLVLSFMPSTFYLSAVLPESLLLALTLGAFLAMARERWILAGVLVSAAAVTRATGILLVGALGVAVLLHWYREGRPAPRALASIPVSLVAPVLWMAYGAWRTGNPFISNHVREAGWERVRWHFLPQIFEPHYVAEATVPIVLAAYAFLLLAIAYGALLVLRERRFDTLPILAFSLVLAFLYLFYSEEQNIVRYLLGIIPGMWLLARAARTEAGLAAVIGVSSMLTVYVAAMWATWSPLY